MQEDELSIDYIEYGESFKIKGRASELELDYEMDATEPFSISFN